MHFLSNAFVPKFIKLHSAQSMHKSIFTKKALFWEKASQAPPWIATLLCWRGLHAQVPNTSVPSRISQDKGTHCPFKEKGSWVACGRGLYVSTVRVCLSPILVNTFTDRISRCFQGVERMMSGFCLLFANNVVLFASSGSSLEWFIVEYEVSGMGSGTLNLRPWFSVRNWWNVLSGFGCTSAAGGGV